MFLKVSWAEIRRRCRRNCLDVTEFTGFLF